MPRVKEILASKGPRVLSVHPDATVLEAAEKMNEHKVGSLVVIDHDHVAGMFTERDVLRRVVGERRDPATTLVAEVMTSEVVCCRPDSGIDEVRTAMKNRRIRHLPVVDDDGNLLGLISIGDINAYQATTQEQTIYFLHEYLYGPEPAGSV